MNSRLNTWVKRDCKIFLFALSLIYFFSFFKLLFYRENSYPFLQADLDEIETETKIFQDFIEDTDQVRKTDHRQYAWN